MKDQGLAKPAVKRVAFKKVERDFNLPAKNEDNISFAEMVKSGRQQSRFVKQAMRRK